MIFEDENLRREDMWQNELTFELKPNQVHVSFTAIKLILILITIVFYLKPVAFVSLALGDHISASSPSAQITTCSGYEPKM